MRSASLSSTRMLGTVPGKRSGASAGNPVNAARCRKGSSPGRRIAAPAARPAASIGIVPPPAIGSTSGSVRASHRDSMINCAAIVSRSGAAPAATRAPRRCRAPRPMSMPTTVRRCSGVPVRRTTKTISGASASIDAATPLDASASMRAFLTTPRSCRGEASKSAADPRSTEKDRVGAAGRRSSSPSAGRSDAKSGSSRTSWLENRSQLILDDVR